MSQAEAPRRVSVRPMLRTLQATRYVTPLREGGSVPAIVECDDDGLYVLKFRGAGQGSRGARSPSWSPVSSAARSGCASPSW